MHRVCKGTFRRVASALSTTLTAWFWMNSKISIELQRGSTSLPRYNFDKRGYCRRVAFCGKLKAGEVEGLGCTSWRLHMVIGEQYFFETSPYLTLVPSCPILSHLVPSCPILSHLVPIFFIAWLFLSQLMRFATECTLAERCGAIHCLRFPSPRPKLRTCM